MKSYRKRYTSYVVMLCLAMLVGMLSGCASDSGGSNTESLNIYEIWATKASFTAIAGDNSATKFQMNLSNTFIEDDLILYFTNRGAQQAGTISLGNFINSVWSRVYGSVKPNAILQGTTATNETVYISCIVDKPVLNKATGQLGFSITYLGGRRPNSNLPLTDIQLIITNNSAIVQPATWSHNLDAVTGVLEPSSNNDGSYTLRLQKAVGTINGITCAPQRKIEKIKLKDYVASWNTRFGTTPPNASITFTGSSLVGLVFTATLSNPVYDESTGTVSFKATNVYAPLGPIGKTAVTLQAPTVFIDAGPSSPFPTYADNVFSIQYRNNTQDYISVWFEGTQPPCSKAMSDKCVITAPPDTYEEQWKKLSKDGVFEKSGTRIYITNKDNTTTTKVDPILNHIELNPGETLRIVPPIVDGRPQWYFNNGVTAGVAAWVTKKGVSMPALMKITKFEYNFPPDNNKVWPDMSGVDGLNVQATMTLDGPGCGSDANCGASVDLPRVCQTNLEQYKTGNDGCPYVSQVGDANVCSNPNQYPIDGDINANSLYPSWVVAQTKFTADNVYSDYKAYYDAAKTAWIKTMQSVKQYDFGGRAMASAPLPPEIPANLTAIKDLKIAYHIWWATNPVAKEWLRFLQVNDHGRCDQYGWALDENVWQPGYTFDENGNAVGANSTNYIIPSWNAEIKKDTYLNIDILQIM